MVTRVSVSIAGGGGVLSSRLPVEYPHSRSPFANPGSVLIASHDVSTAWPRSDGASLGSSHAQGSAGKAASRVAAGGGVAGGRAGVGVGAGVEVPAPQPHMSAASKIPRPRHGARRAVATVDMV